MHDGYIYFKYDKKEADGLYHIFNTCIRNSAKKAKTSENTHLIFYFAKIYDVLDDNGIAFSSRSYAVSWK